MKIFGFNIKLPWLSSREKRGAERIRAFETVYLDYESPVHAGKKTSEAKNISVTGVYFNSRVKLPPGTLLALNLRFAQSSPIKDPLPVRARVAYCEKRFHENWYRVGCEFTVVDAATHQKLQAFVDWMKEQREKNLFFRWREPGEKE